MRATGPKVSRRAFLAAGAAIASEERIADVLARMVTALTNSDAGAFMRPIDRSMPRYRELRRNVEALVAVNQPGSSVAIMEQSGDERTTTVRVDWALEISGSRRSAEIVCKMERRSGGWTIVEIAPIEFFAPERSNFE